MNTELVLRLGAFLVVFALMATWEWVAPARLRRLTRARRWTANLGLVVLGNLLVRAVLPTSAVVLAELAHTAGWGLLNRLALPGWLAVFLAVVALDFIVYLQHVLYHAVPALARLHAVHHADPDFDFTTGIRFHPLEILISTLIKFAAVVAVGAPVLAVLTFEILLNGTAMFNHGNVALPGWLECWVRRVLVTPDMHRVHHSVVATERDSNYGFCLSIWDRLLGTYTTAPRGELDIGLPKWRDPEVIATLRGTLGLPFRP